MARFAPLGNFIFGNTVLGVPPVIGDNANLTVSPLGYNALQLNWSPPSTSTFTEQVLMRSSFGVPTDIFSNGAIILDESLGATPTGAFSASFLDQPLVSGLFYYYALFGFASETSEYILIGAAQGLVLTDYGFADKYVEWMPDFYLELDSAVAQTVTFTPPQVFLTQPLSNGSTYSSLSTTGIPTPIVAGSPLTIFETSASPQVVTVAANVPTGAETIPVVSFTASSAFAIGTSVALPVVYPPSNGAPPAGPLVRFLELIGFEMDWMRSEIESIFTLTNPSLISGAALPLMLSNLGMTYEPELGMGRSRVLAENAVRLYKTRGIAGSETVPGGISGAASAFSGYPCVATVGAPNIQGINVSEPTNTIAGGNMEIQLDDAVFDESQGHWASGNNGTILEVVPASTYGVTPPNTAYQPVPMLPTFTTPVGYLDKGWATDTPNVLLLQTFSESLSWSEQSAASALPPGRLAPMLAYNQTDSTVIMFGGAQGSTYFNDTWKWDGSVWTQLTPTRSPQARANAGFAYDQLSGYLILYGGRTAAGNVLSDTWAWTGTTWLELFPTVTPGPRYGHQMCTSTLGVVAQGHNVGLILNGGTETPPGGTFTPFSGTWVWTGANWFNLSYSSPPPGRAFGAMTWVTSHGGYAILYGGQGSGTGFEFRNDTWAWTATGGWTNITASSPSLPASGNSPMAYDSVNDNVILLATALTGVESYWTMNTATKVWASTSPAHNPGVRFNTMLVKDPGHHLMFFGGQLWNNSQGQSDTWRWTGTDYVQDFFLTTTPVSRFGACMVYDSTHDVVVLFGGAGYDHALGATTYFDDLWTWNGSAWTQVTSNQATPPYPAPRVGASMAWSSTSGVGVLFGGKNASGTLADTWIWNGTNWSHVTPGSSPPATAYGAMIFDPVSNRIIFFDGQNTWKYNISGNTWTELVAANPLATGQTVKHEASFVYTTGGVGLLFGGVDDVDGGGPFNDTWEWSNAGGWVQQTPATSPPARSLAVMAYDASIGQVFLFGGQSGPSDTNVVLNDTWIWDGTTWKSLLSEFFGGPFPRTAASMDYWPDGQTMVLFGGSSEVVPVPSPLGDTWVASIQNLFELDIVNPPSDITTLGLPVPQQATPVTIVSSAQAYPVSTLRSFLMQLNWYSINGSFISSSSGAPVTEIANQWVTFSVVASPPPGAYYYSREIMTSSTIATDLHLIAAVKTEYNVLATPGPSTWTPPRDIQVNLLPVRQNLAIDAQGLAGGFGWVVQSGTFTTVTSGPTWPAADIIGGYRMVLDGSGHIVLTSPGIPVIPGSVITASMYVAPINHTAAGGTWKISISWFASSNPASFLGFRTEKTFSEPTSGAAFTRFVMQGVEVPTGANVATVAIVANSGVASSVHYMTGVLVEPSSGLGNFFDGNSSPFEDFLFEGTPNESVSDYYPALTAKLSRLIDVMPDYIPIGSTFSLFIGPTALANAGLVG